MIRLGFGVTTLSRGAAGKGIDGIGAYTRELGRALAADGDMGLTTVSFGAHQAADLIPNAETLELGRFPPRALLSELMPVSYAGSGPLQRRIDLFHATDHLVPRLRRVPVVATVMDAIPISHPEWISGQRLRSQKAWLWRRTTRRATAIVTISEHSRREIVRHFDVSPDAVSVIPLGVDDRFHEEVGADERIAVCRRHGLPSDFFLFVGTLQPRKNLARVIQAHRALPASMRSACPLVVVGRPGWQCDDVVNELEALSREGTGKWLRYLPDRDLRALMQSARALVFPSLHEGFGLPVLEAFASGLPVITSDTTALPEVAGDAAALVDPADTGQIAAAMTRVVEDDDWADTLRERGRGRVRLFSWKTCARRTMNLYERILG